MSGLSPRQIRKRYLAVRHKETACAAARCTKEGALSKTGDGRAGVDRRHVIGNLDGEALIGVDLEARRRTSISVGEKAEHRPVASAADRCRDDAT